jgi:hypothetical protein
VLRLVVVRFRGSIAGAIKHTYAVLSAHF